LVKANTIASRDFFSLPRSCAFLGSFQTAGSSSSSFTCSSFSDFLSKSKIPPKFGFARREVAEQGGEGVDAFGFHGFLLFYGYNQTSDYTLAGGTLPAPRGDREKLTFSPQNNKNIVLST
jgi:hypothetical protein